MEEMQILQRKMFTSVDDIVNLHMIDFHRCNGYWDNNFIVAARSIADWLIGQTYIVIRCDMSNSPQRDDFPTWYHNGNHMELARLYWNFFHDKFQGTLIFEDMPDFTGTMKFADKSVKFYGDIGRVSASTFALDVLPHIQKDDIWISILDRDKHVVIEFTENIGMNIKRNVLDNLGVEE